MVAYAAALRIAQFNTRNEFTDWDVALHTFTFANAVHHCVRRISGSKRMESQLQSHVNYQQFEMTRGLFDAAMRVYLNRFLNIPPAPIHNLNHNLVDDSNIERLYVAEEKLSTLLDKQQQVDAAGQLVADFYGRLLAGNSININHEFQLEQFMNFIGKLLLREDRSFHLIQMIEAALKQCSTVSSESSSSSVDEHVINKEYHFVLAAVRYLAAHSPTMRSQTHTYQTALQLSLGQNLFE